jgi:hypothetical protein
LGFILFRAFTFSTLCFFRKPSALGLIAVKLVSFDRDALQRLTRGEVGLTLSSLPALLRFVTFLPSRWLDY